MLLLESNRSGISPGAHTLGFSHCEFFADRLYRSGSAREPDPTLDAHYAFTLRAQCPPSGADANVVQALDPVSPFAFDNSYYKILRLNRGLLASDQALWTDPRTKPLVTTFASNQSAFFASFASAMVKLGSVGVKAGSQGEIRRTCTSFNS
jgi:peroxidase